MSTQVKENLESIIEGYKKLFASKLSKEQLALNIKSIRNQSSNVFTDSKLIITAGNTDNVRIEVNDSETYFLGSASISTPSKLEVEGTIVAPGKIPSVIFNSTTRFAYDQMSYLLIIFYSDSNYLGYFTTIPSQDKIQPLQGGGNGGWS